jgi:hypothetical protein
MRIKRRPDYQIKMVIGLFVLVAALLKLFTDCK